MTNYSNNILDTLEAMLESNPGIPEELEMTFGDRKIFGVCSDLYQTVRIGGDVYEVTVRVVTPFKVLGE